MRWLYLLITLLIFGCGGKDNDMGQNIVTVDISTHDGTVLRVCTGEGFITEPTDSPPNTIYLPRLVQPGSFKQDMFSNLTTSGTSSVTYGEVVVTNKDHALDGWKQYGFDGRALVMRFGSVGGAYPATFTSREYTIEQAVFDDSTITFRLRGKESILDNPVQPIVYEGSNVLPDGSEGNDDLKGKVKPQVFGTAPNMTPNCVNTSKLIYQASISQVVSITVKDGAVALTKGADYTSYEDMMANAPAAGQYRCYLAEGMFRLGSSPVYSITCDVVENASLTAGQLAANLMTSLVIMSSTKFNCVKKVYVCGIAQVGNAICVAWYYTDDASVQHPYFSVTQDGGTSWTTTTPPAYWMIGVNCLKVSGNRVIAIGQNAQSYPLILYTDNLGGLWTYTTPTGLAATSRIYDVVMSGTRYIVAARDTGDTGLILVSDNDLLSWTQKLSVANASGMRRLIRTTTGRIVVGDGIGHIFTSDDNADNWTDRGQIATAGGNTSVYSLCEGNGIILMGSYNPGHIYTSSTNGTSWADRGGLPNTSEAMIPAIVYHNQTFIASTWYSGAIDSLGVLFSSKDGISWTKQLRLSAEGNSVDCMFSAGTRLLAGSRGGGFFNLLFWGYNLSTNVATLDAANDGPVGWLLDQATTKRQALDIVAPTMGLFSGFNLDGSPFLEQLTPPSGEPVITLTDQQIKSFATVASNDAGRGLPYYKVTVRYGRNYTVQTSGLAGSITDADRAAVAQEWKSVTAIDNTVLDKHPLAPELTIDTLFQDAAHAQIEADRLLAMLSVERDMLRTTAALTDEQLALLNVGIVGSIVYPRYDYTNGKLMRVIGIQPDLQSRMHEVIWWG